MTPLLLWFALQTASAPSGCKPQLAPLRTGSSSSASSLPFWRRREAGDWGGDGWLGWNDQGTTLRPVTFIVQDLGAAILNPDEVTVQTIPNVEFAVRCVANVRAGAIQTIHVAGELQPNRPIRIRLGLQQYDVSLQSSREDLFDAQVILSDGRLRQVLYSVDGFADEPHFDIVWAGDLDRDGQLDLIIDMNAKYSRHPYRLLLSSMASRGELVREAALFETGD